MSTLQVFRSNRTEVLVQALHACLDEPLQDPMAAELLVVQGRGMAVWLNMQLAKRRGIWANTEFVYPKGFVRRAFAVARADGESEPQNDPFARGRLLWAVLSTLPAFLERGDFAPLARYLRHDSDGTLRFQLAEQIAGVFDEYLTYRPELLRKWEKTTGGDTHQSTPGGARGRKKPIPDSQLALFGVPSQLDERLSAHEAWQAILWRALVKKLGTEHSANQEEQFFTDLGRGSGVRGLPERICVFGLSNLPPLYVRVLAALSRHTRVQVFLLSPSREYFGDSIRRQRAPTQSLDQNPILLSSGALAAELHEVLVEQLEALGVSESDESLFLVGGAAEADSPPPLTMLQRLQNDILAHRNGPLKALSQLDPSDASIRMHACHSPIREVEVLHDQLLALLDAPEGGHTSDAPQPIRPEDIIIMMPNVDEYAPLIEAVFERSRDDPRFIPYRISDRGLQADSPILDGFLRLVAMAGSRCTATEVLDVLALEPVREQFGIASTDLPLLSDWVRESNIRWAEDGAHRAEHGLHPDDANTWLFGLRRLLVGYAINLQDDTCEGVLPYTEIEGKAGVLLGRFSHFIHTLFAELQSLRTPKPALQWQSQLGRVLTTLLVHNSTNAWQHQQVLAALAELTEGATSVSYDEPIHLSVIRRLLTSHFSDNRAARGFLSGGVTFCAMVPMRSIPFRVIGLVGMSDSAFPRQSHRADFNLLEFGGYPRRLGDPSRRMDDRYLFLEVLLAAREQLLISYVGQSVRDNTPVPPSIVISELLDYLLDQYSVGSFGSPHMPGDLLPQGSAWRSRQQVLDQIVTRHPLQPFSPRYFSQQSAQLFSYEHAFLQGAKLLGPERRPVIPLFEPALPPMTPAGDLMLSDLLEFFASPAAFLFRKRLVLELGEDSQEVPDREPLQLDGLASYQVGAPALEHELQGMSEEQSLRLTRASGLLPAGAPGQYEFSQVRKSALPIADAVRAIRIGEPARTLAASVPLAGSLKLCGDVDDLWPAGQVTYQYSRLRGKHLLTCWIRHLVLCHCRPSGVAPHSWLIGRASEGEGKCIHRFSEVLDPLPHLQRLVTLFLRGQEAPLLLFPDASFAFVKALNAKRGDVRQSLFSASTAWRKELQFSRVLLRLYGDDRELTAKGPSQLAGDPSPTFSEVSEQVFGVLFDHLEDVG
jgi:exodeoxyribonuclease V gamma subunit